MPDTDAPQVEPLTYTLEEALAKLGKRGYTLAVHHRKGAPEYVLCDMYSAFARGSFGHWKDAVEAVLGRPVVPRDEAAELVGVLQELRARFHAAGRRPEECYEMSLIDEALARVRSEP